jgi:hypothetical protein
VWSLRALTAKILQEKFMHEFRDNQKLDLKSFAERFRGSSICAQIGGSYVELERQHY